MMDTEKSVYVRVESGRSYKEPIDLGWDGLARGHAPGVRGDCTMHIACA